MSAIHAPLIPAQAEIQKQKDWMPAFAGMSGEVVAR
jgi:hypothetical protein